MMRNTEVFKGKSYPVKVSQDGPQRLVIGLSWDPVDSLFQKSIDNPRPPAPPAKTALGKFGMFFADTGRALIDAPKALAYWIHLEAAEKKEDLRSREKNFSHFDVDLSCHIFGPHQEFLTRVSPETNREIDDSGKVYHSGDDFSGLGRSDDEQILIHLRDVPENYSDIVIVVESDSKFKISEIKNLKVRLADSLTETTLVEAPIEPGVTENNYAFIFGCLYKDRGQWNLFYIGEYADYEDWDTYLQRYLY